MPIPQWRRHPEPKVRYGQSSLPGLVALARIPGIDARSLLERAEAVRERRFTYRGWTVHFPEHIDWAPRGTSPEWRTALASLDELFALGVAATLAPTVEARREWYGVAAGLVRESLGRAGRGRGIGWEVPALARRVGNLIQVQAFFAPELRTDVDLRRSLLESLYQQALTLATAVEQATGPSKIAAGRALFMAGRLFDGLEARGWLEAGATLLWSQLREQVHEDGGHAGRNPATHARVLADYLEVLALLRASNDDVPIWARKRIKGMADFLTRLLHPDDDLPAFHGAGPGEHGSARELLAAAAVILHEPGLAVPGELPGVWPLLLLGEPGVRVYQTFPRRRQGAEPRALRRTGYFVLAGEPGDVMLLDGAAPPPGGSAAAFAYELSVSGERLVVGPGAVGEAPAPWPAYFGSARAHNAVTVDGTEPVARPGDTARGLEVSDVHWVVRDGLLYFTGTHDGFAPSAASPGTRYRRRVVCLPGHFWLVCDEVLGSGTASVESHVHFHPAVAVDAACRGQLGFSAARSEAARVQIVTAGATEARLMGGVEEPEPQGWCASAAGERRAAPVLVLAAAGRLPLALGYALLPRFDGAAALSFQHDAFQIHVRLRLGEREHVMTIVQDDIELHSRQA